MNVNLGVELLKDCYKLDLLTEFDKLNVARTSIDLMVIKNEFHSLSVQVNSKAQLYVILNYYAKAKYPVTLDVLVKRVENKVLKCERLKHNRFEYTNDVSKLVKEIIETLDRIYYMYVS